MHETAQMGLRQFGGSFPARNASAIRTISGLPINIGVRWCKVLGLISRSRFWPSDARPPACSRIKASGLASYIKRSLRSEERRVGKERTCRWAGSEREEKRKRESR